MFTSFQRSKYVLAPLENNSCLPGGLNTHTDSWEKVLEPNRLDFQKLFPAGYFIELSCKAYEVAMSRGKWTTNVCWTAQIKTNNQIVPYIPYVDASDRKDKYRHRYKILTNGTLQLINVQPSRDTGIYDCYVKDRDGRVYVSRKEICKSSVFTVVLKYHQPK